MTSDRKNAAEPDGAAQDSPRRSCAGHLERGSRRPIAARGPGDGAEELRRAYLDLLKLALCDLAGARTLTVSRRGGRATHQPVFTRELDEDELPLRVIGADWPFSGLTMVGLERLDDLQACIEQVAADDVEGDVIEAGAWRGGASILIRATLNSLGQDQRTVWVADSFQGLPKPDEAFPEDGTLDLSWLDYLAVPQEEVRRYFQRLGLERGVRFLEGFFEATLPTLAGMTWALVRLDGDTYESTWTGLECLYPGLSPGGFVVIDDYQLIPECRQAVADYRRRHGIEEPIEMIDIIGARWRRESAKEPSGRSRPGRLPGRRGARRGARNTPAGSRPCASCSSRRSSRAAERRAQTARPGAPAAEGLRRRRPAMIVFGTAVTDDEQYRRFAEPG